MRSYACDSRTRRLMQTPGKRPSRTYTGPVLHVFWFAAFSWLFWGKIPRTSVNLFWFKAQGLNWRNGPKTDVLCPLGGSKMKNGRGDVKLKSVAEFALNANRA